MILLKIINYFLCLLAYSSSSYCEAALLNVKNSCTLLSNQITLIATTFSKDTKLFSKNEMKMCFDSFYTDFNASACRPQK